MVPFDNAALRAQVVADYNALSHGITDATEMDRILATVMHTTISAVRESMKASNSVNPVAQLPAKILVACLTYLSFSDRIRVSHVCCAWRATALADPEVWTTISMDYDMSNRLELLKMALGRAGTLPLDLRVSTTGRTRISEVDAVLGPHLGQLRRVSWIPDEQSALWTLPAPRLEYLASYHGLALGPNFLGGQEGVLRSLRIAFCALPGASPALSTVVDLRVQDMNRSANPASFRQLFTLLPHLETLHLGGLGAGFSDHLPRGPAPASLREVTLETSARNYDLMQHYLAWDACRFRVVSLAMGYLRESDLHPLLQNATLLWLNCTGSSNGAQLMSEHPNSISRSVSLASSLFGSCSQFGKHVFAARGALQNVHTVKLSHVALEEFLPVLATLGALKHLVIHIASTRILSHEAADNAAPEDTLPRYGLDWAPLSYLPRLPRLESLTLQVCRRNPREPPTSLGDADDLLNVLASTDTRSLPPIIIEGFADTPIDLHGLQLSFNTEADFAELVFRMPRVHMHHAFWFW